MSCPFAQGGLRAVQALEAAQAAAAAGSATAECPAAAASGPPASPPRMHPRMASYTASPSQSSAPLDLFTGGLRTSLGVENAHPLSVWMKEMQARGGLKGVDIEAELATLSMPPSPSLEDNSSDPLVAAQQDKTWKEKRLFPPVQLGAPAMAPPPAGPPSDSQAYGTVRQPTLYPGVLTGRIDHNSHGHLNPMTKYDQEVTYWNYIFPEVLCSLQNGRQGKGLNHHDEHLFILVHQVFELWFKQIMWELEYVRNSLLGYRDPKLPARTIERNPLARCVQRLNRADKIMRLATEGYAIMETMDPADFLEFRDFLSPSSGFQSVQLREMEILLGLKDEERIPCAGRHYREAFMANGENKTGVFDQRLHEEKSLKEALFIFLRRATPSHQLDEFLAAYFKVLHTQNSEKSKDFEEELALLHKMLARSTDERERKYLNDLVEKAAFGKTLAANSSNDVAEFFHDPLLGKQRAGVLFLLTYHTHPQLKDAAELVESILNFEQAVLLWRQRHARMVESFIGRRPGTGGSSGVEYIDQTAARYRVFADLWRIRSLCVARSKIDFAPDDGAAYQGVHMEHLETDYAIVREKLNKEMREMKEAAAAAAAAATTSP